ncbi:MAG TPA: tetratricopeptide repeat protein, partial [Pyrinomonadaceae bacterium]|nr:tetratricopeptide repeat protein [Pyrinomonadaceae bacterium]
QLTRLVPDQAHHLERLSQLGGAEEEVEFKTLPDFETATEHTAESAAVGDQFVFDSQTLSSPVGEAEFEWNPVGDIADTRAESESESAGERGFTFETVVAEELASGTEHVIADADADAQSRNAAIRAQELESVDFYIAQGYADIAIDTLDLLERQFGPHADIDVRRHQLQTRTERSKAATVDQKIVLDDGNAAPSQPEPEAPSPAIVATSDLKPANPQQPPPPHEGIHPSLAEVFEEYRVSAEKEADTAVNGDYETHYNLGLAYKEMDLFEEALEEFQIAVAMVTPGDSTPRYLQCCNLLGHCFMRKGVPQLALKWFNKGFNAPGANEDERQALRYELGDVYEQIGELDRAIDIFTEVYGINVSYRGVNERLRRLQAQTALRDDSAVMNQQALRPS